MRILLFSIFISAFLPTPTAAGKLKFWEDYAPLSCKKDFVELLRKEAAKAGHKNVFDYPPLMCHYFRANVVASADRFTKNLKALLKQEGITNWLVEAIFKSNEKSFYESYVQLVQKAFAYFVPDDEKETPEAQQAGMTTVELRESVTRWIDLAFDKTIPELKTAGKVNTLSFNYKDVGAFYAGLLYDKDFVCMGIPELSLLIFKMFYFRVYEPVFIDEFFTGFFKVFQDIPQSSEAKSMFATNSVNTFFGYNMLVLLGIKSAYAEKLLDYFNADDARKATLLDNFKLLYSVVLETVILGERERAKQEADFWKDLMTLKEHALRKAGQKTAYLSLKFFQGLAKGALFGPAGKVGGFLLSAAFSKDLSTIDKEIKKIVDPEDKSGDSVTLIIDGIDSSLDLTNLREFMEYFEQQVETHNSCAYCHLQLRNQKYAATKACSDEDNIII